MLVTTLGYGATVPNALVAHVQLHQTRGARLHISGIPWTAGRSALSRIYAAFECCDLPRVAGAFTLHIRPTDQLKELTALDFPIALALLGHAGVVPAEALPRVFSASEMGVGRAPPTARRQARRTPARHPRSPLRRRAFTPGRMEPNTRFLGPTRQGLAHQSPRVIRGALARPPSPPYHRTETGMGLPRALEPNGRAKLE